MHLIEKTRLKLAIGFLAFLAILLVSPLASAANPTITLTPTSQAPTGTVTVTGTGFAASKPVAIAFGSETNASETNMAYSGSGTGPYGGFLAKYPIKPGTFNLTSDTTSGGGVVTPYTDNGDGTLSSTSLYFVSGSINYVTGQWSRTSSVDLTGISQLYYATYTTYSYNLTSASPITTNSTGGFTAVVTVPNVASGNYTVTAIDTAGNRATSSLIVSSTTIPEGLNLEVMLVLSTIVAVFGAHFFKKNHRQPEYQPNPTRETHT